jgi:hypothetical protein
MPRLSLRLSTELDMSVLVSARVLIVVLMVPLLAAATRLDMWSISEMDRELKAENERSHEYEGVTEDSDRRIEIKQELVRQLISGRTTLAEVTAQFHYLNRARPDCMLGLRISFPGKTDEEMMAENVMAYATMQLADEPLSSRLSAEVRLDAEFHRFIKSLKKAD